jgi:cell division protein ZapA
MADNFEVRLATTAVSAEIYDQTYQLRAHDPEYVQRLASAVDAKMRAVAASGTVDSLRVAVLAALNLADDLQRLQEHCRALRGSVSETQISLRTRANSLSGILDSVLDDPHPDHEEVTLGAVVNG